MGKNAGSDDGKKSERSQLERDWKLAFGRPPPKGVHSPFLRRGLAWYAQMQVSARWRDPRELIRLRRSLRADALPELKPGTRLVREWQGRTYEALASNAGFEFEGKPYRSLSAIARKITGTARSGPAFFGLK